MIFNINETYFIHDENKFYSEELENNGISFKKISNRSFAPNRDLFMILVTDQYNSFKNRYYKINFINILESLFGFNKSQNFLIDFNMLRSNGQVYPTSYYIKTFEFCMEMDFLLSDSYLELVKRYENLTLLG